MIANTLLHALFRALLGPKLGDVFWPPLAAPLTEETAKGLVVPLIAAVWRHEFHNTLDGIVYGALAGLGFAAVENVSYFLRALEGGGLAALGISFYVRALLGGLSHSAYTACTGAGIGYAREAKTPAERVTAPLVGYFLAMFLHFAWNFTASVLSPVFDRLTGGSLLLDLFVVTPLTVAVLEGPAWVTLLLLVHLAWKQERSLIAAHLQDEPEDVVRKGELPLLLSPLRRFRLLWQALGRSGVRQWADLRPSLTSWPTSPSPSTTWRMADVHSRSWTGTEPGSGSSAAASERPPWGRRHDPRCRTPRSSPARLAACP
jgi:hypothetical protein